MKKKELASWVEWLIRNLCGPYWAEGIQGDMLQNYLRRTKERSRWNARLCMYLELFGLLRFIFYKKEKKSNSMFKEYFKIGFRVIIRNKIYSFINLFGLGAGMACALLIYLWVQDEISFDRFHEHTDELYRIEFDRGNPYTGWATPAELGPAIQAQIPQVEMVSRYMLPRNSLILQKDQQTFHENGYAAADPDFFSMFSFDFIQGDPQTALNDPYSMVMSETLAKKYFADENPIGQTIKVNNKHLMTVRGVIKDVPSNSSLQFDYLFPFEFLKILDWYEASWASVWLQTYVKVGSNVDKVSTGKEILESIMRDKHNRWEEKSVEALVLNPIGSMRLKAYAYTGSGFEQKNLQTIYTFSGLGVLILLIACINFMNLATARSAKRAKEIGMRKVVGAVKGNIRNQFLGEALLQTGFALVLAFVFVLLLLSPFNELSGKTVELSQLFQGPFLLATLVTTIVVALFSGSYPAFYLSAFRPIKVLKGQLSAGPKSSLLRRVLVVFQFGLSIFLIIGTLVIYYQMDFVRGKELGYDKEHVLYIPLVHEDTKAGFESLKSAWLTNPQIANVSSSQVRPSRIGWSSSAYWEGKDEEDYEDIYHNRIEVDYLKTLGIEIVEGRDYSTEFLSDDAEDGSGGFIVNETMARKMSAKGQAVGMMLQMAGNKGPVVGVMRDFHFSSLKVDIRPLAIMLLPANKRFALLKLNSTDMRATVNEIEATWVDLLPDFPFEYHFFDEDFDAMYKADEQLGKLLGTFSVLAIIIASLGLFGLASFTAEERRKEVAIRKVLGASHLKVTYLLCRDFLTLVILANLIAWPLGKWIMGSWLESFAYRIDFGIGIFLLATVLALMIAMFTIVFQTFKAALASPVYALKYE